MEIRAQQFFSGPNVMALHRAARIVVAESSGLLDALDQTIIQKAQAILREVLDHRAEGLAFQATCLADLVAAILIYLQQASRHPVKHFYINQLSQTTVEIGFEITRKSMLSPLLSCVEELIAEARSLAPTGAFGKVYAHVEERLKYRLTNFIPDDQCIAARRLGVCVRHESRGTIHLGEGFRTRLLGKGFTEVTKKLGYRFAQDKMETARLLQGYGLPTPQQRKARTIAEALEAAHRIGYPVVVKPRGGNKGTGVSVNVRTDDEVRKAYRYAEDDGSGVIIETFISGTDHRLLVINGQVVAAVQRIPAKVRGDGIRRVSELMERANRLERRDGLYLFPLTFDDEVEQTLAKQGVAIDSIPEEGRTIYLRGAANQSLGGTTVDVTDVVHPDNRIAAMAAAEACLLDVAGVDFVIPDIRQSWRAAGGGIVEINAGPGVDLHMAPTVGVSRDISRQLVRALFPADTPSHIATVIVAGLTRKRQTSRHTSALLSLLGYHPGMYVGGKVFVGGQEVYSGNYESALSALLDHRSISAAVVECSPATLARYGTVLESTSVTVLTDSSWLASTTSGSSEAWTNAQRLQRLAVDIAREGVVIDATKPELVATVAHLPPRQTIFVWAETKIDRTPLERHLEAGGQAVSIEIDPEQGSSLLYRCGSQANPIVSIADLHGQSASQVREIMLACGTLIALGWQPSDFYAQVKAIWSTDNSSDTSLSCRTEESGWFAMCDPQDADGMRRLASICRTARPLTVSVIITGENWTSGRIVELKQLLEPFAPTWCCAGSSAEKIAEALCAEGIATPHIHSFERVDTAMQILNQRKVSRAMRVLLSCDISERNRFIQPPLVPPWSTSESGMTWTPSELAKQFSGVWVGGPNRGWTINGIAWGCHAISAGDLAIIPGFPEGPEALAEAENNVFRAFDHGARAVIAANRPPNLNRWLPFMVCDDPELGLDRLANEARSRFEGVVVALSCDEAETYARTLHTAWPSLSGGMESPFLDYSASPPDLPVNRRISLSLCRMPRASMVAILPVCWDRLGIQLLRPTIWITVVRDARDEPNALAMLRELPPRCRVLASVAEPFIDHWQKLSATYPLFSWTVIGLCDASHLAEMAHSLITDQRRQI